MNIRGDVFEIRLGLPGSGKTLTQTELIVLPALLDGLDVYCNYWVNWSGSNYHYFSEISEVLGVRNCIVVFDEIQTVLDPRDWSKEGSDVRRFFQEHRKRHIDIYGTTQHLSLIAKSALIIVDRFLVCDLLFNSNFWRSLHFPYVVVSETDMTLAELRLDDKMVLMDYPGDDDGGDMSFSLGSSSLHWFSKKRLLHRDLDDLKVEHFYTFCPLCQARQGDPVPLTFTLDEALKIVGTCPKHKGVPLEVRLSGIYDTDYEVEPVPRLHYWRAFERCSCGRYEPYTGYLSTYEMLAKSELEKK